MARQNAQNSTTSASEQERPSASLTGTARIPSQDSGIRNLLLKRQKLLADRHIDLDLTDGAKEFLAEAGYDPVYGARPLRRAIQRYVQDQLAPMLLSGEFKEGDTILVDRDTEGLTFKREESCMAFCMSIQPSTVSVKGRLALITCQRA